MNFVYISPHFPPNYVAFSEALHKRGVNVLGIADEQFERLPSKLVMAMREYYRVPNMQDYDQLLRACGHFTHRYGKIDRVESHNEYWLETDARLRTDFNVFGVKSDSIGTIKRKSLMKQRFLEAGVLAPRGRVAHTRDEVHAFIDEVGYPIVAKPDIGVGAAGTYKLSSDDELKFFCDNHPGIDYILEEFIAGQLLSFDGLVDRDNHIVFCTGHWFSGGIMDIVNTDDHVYYYSLRELPADLEKAGRAIVKAFDIRERFFHIEMFRRDRDKKIVALEVNMRPPGGLTTDMFNYANDIDVYGEYANIVTTNRFAGTWSRPYHCCYVGRKDWKQYAHSHEDVLAECKSLLVHHQRMQSIFARAIGDYGYLLRSPKVDDVVEAAHYIHALKQ
jgi:hypothetical protein